MRQLEEREFRDGRIAGPPSGRGRSVTVNLNESPLGWLKARGMISDAQYEAGERVRADYETASLGPCVTMRWDSGPRAPARGAAPDHVDPSHVRIAAKDRFDGAIAAAGPGLSDIVWRVICANETLPNAEKALGWPVRAGKLVLTLALDRIADFYGIR
ncbi:DUF6456 domain-containing protein [Stakelama pacifica]|uniref:DUF6456 domain-containing protein n=1 Tax=Stakelama pacifica TaxID=517720 RepID=A0A4R6FUU8_9SPHN|nr:DUF6456 domain-containing protein [Stakelama pacifica]TDN85659.1 hypothetical protein EV664_102368 [Stakelama pacifica]GGO92008.1 hypothetical protein GCM10011329_08030 [Stakelama pacifica]